ncbi:hypothetical protein KUW00_17960 [Halomonas sp. DP5N14-9]|uniref:hypothetical protein n=1 Tax=Halomonas sp. DP5N14-9 TaxID=2859075 RepID=UPI001C99914F|nr:hypothetical protein [Halomonas sp. DP5N14-9]MBY5942764.1 hypothetical protein [Halomonas sp. DP5N14-9]
MAVRSLGQLTLDLVAKVGGFTGPMDKASRQAKKSMTSIASSVKSASQAMATAGTAVSAAAAGFLVYAKSAADSARETKNQAAVANAGVEAFQRMAYASTTVGVEQDKLAGILQDVNDRVGDFMATGGGEMADFFENIAPQVGVTAEQFRNLSGPQALQLYYDSLEKANLSQQDMTFYLEAMASDTTALIPLLRDGGKGFADMGDEADRLGIVLSELDIAKLNQFSAEFDKSLKLLSSMGQILVTELTPYMTALGDELVDAATDTDDLRDSFAVAFRQAVESIGPVLDKIHDLRIAGAEIMVWVGELDVAFANFAQNAWGHVDALIDSIIEGINRAITGLQSLPGFGDLELIDYDFGRSSFMGRIIDQTYDAREQLSKYNLELSELLNAGAPSTVISDYLDKVDEQARQLEETLSGVTDPAGGATLPSAKDREAAQKAQAAAAKEAAEADREATREIERQRSAYRGLLDDLYPLQASQREFREEMELLKLADVAGEVDDLADAQRRLREASADQVASGMEDAPSYAGLDGSVGGAFGEIAKIDEAQEALESWYETQLEMLAEFREARADLNSEWDEREQEIQQQHQDQLLQIERARQQAQLVAAESVFGDLADVTRTFAGEQSGIYKAMFAVQKAAAIAQSLVAIQQGIAMAAANPFPYNLAAMASVASATAGIVSNIASIAGPDGMAHDGIDSVPQDGTWLLQKGERVTTADTSAKLDRTLDDVQRNRSDGGGTTVNVIEDASRAGQVNERQDTDGKAIIDVVVANITGDGQIHKAMSGKYALSTKGR